MNHLYSRMTINAPTPELTMGATILHWTDRSPATIVLIEPTSNGTVIGLADDSYRFDRERDEFDITPCALSCAPSRFFRALPAGGWECVTRGKRPGTWKKCGGPGLILGRRERYYDPSF
jgi:hypothetical protein